MPMLATYPPIAPAHATAAFRARHPAHLPLKLRYRIGNDAISTCAGAACAGHIMDALATHAAIAPARATAAFRARYPAHVPLNHR